jgi:HAD superfamily hydrolase (TIGR01484 family)
VARPFRSEMAELHRTVEWAGTADISSLVEAISRSARAPLVAIGSGGSLSAAAHLARMHRRYFGQVAVALSPYAYSSDPIAHDAHHWIISAGGSNVDVVSAVDTCIAGEPEAINVLTMKDRSRLATVVRQSSSVNFHRAAIPSKKDGFLATNSLLGFCELLTRAYKVVADGDDDWENSQRRLLEVAQSGSTWQMRWREEVRQLSPIEHLIVLHDMDTDLGAADLESKLTEAAIKNVQLADYRHFAHGRHHWLAKNSENSGVLFFRSGGGSRLAERTEKLIPASVPTAVIDVNSEGDLAELTSLVAAFVVTDELAHARGIDPGQPGVPEFGRKLYSLRLPARPARPLIEVAIRRKSRVAGVQLNPEHWTSAYREVLDRQRAASFAGVVFDYDGTLVDTRDRFEPIRPEVTKQLVRLVEGGITVAVATGRGRSAGVALRAALPHELWAKVIVGYYNGAAQHSLHDEEAPTRVGRLSGQLARVEAVLKVRLDDVPGLKLEVRPHQLTVTFGSAGSEQGVWTWIEELLDILNASDLRVVRSSHSIDIVHRKTSKAETVRHLSGAIAAAGGEILRIGDRGAWPGNDFDLLSDPFGLSVDQVSGDPNGCWNLAPAGLSGVSALLQYFDSMHVEDSSIRLRGEPW